MNTGMHYCAYVHVLRIRNAYLYVFRINIQADTYKYAMDKAVHMSMYSEKQNTVGCRIIANMHSLNECTSVCICMYVFFLNISYMHTHMHRIQLI
jgi:hypothetical protein